MKTGRYAIIMALFLVVAIGLFKLSSVLRSRVRPLPPKNKAIEQFKDTGGGKRPAPDTTLDDSDSHVVPPSEPSFFLPGSLSLTKWQTVNRCFVDPEVYAEHLPSNAYCVVSEKYKLIYYLIPKSGSSTNREVMTSSLAGRETTTKECDQLQKANKAYRTIGFVRDPSSRIYSSYEEAIARKLNDVASIPENLQRFVHGLPNYKAYEKLFDTPHLLTERFEQFLEDWDGRDLFDNHLSLQVPLLAHQSGRTRSFVWLGEVGKLDADWKKAAALLKFPPPTVIHGRSFPRRMNTSTVTAKAKRRICKLLALDYCCLNFPFPPECTEEQEESLGCAWRQFPDGSRLIVPVGGP